MIVINISKTIVIRRTTVILLMTVIAVTTVIPVISVITVISVILVIIIILVYYCISGSKNARLASARCIFSTRMLVSPRRRANFAELACHMLLLSVFVFSRSFNPLKWPKIAPRWPKLVPR